MTKETKAKVNAISEYYQKIMVLIMTVLIGYIATIAGGVKTDIEVLKNNTENTMKIIDSNQVVLKQHSNDLHQLDNRVVLVESKIN